MHVLRPTRLVLAVAASLALLAASFELTVGSDEIRAAIRAAQGAGG
jgi:hypothetical protein